MREVATSDGAERALWRSIARVVVLLVLAVVVVPAVVATGDTLAVPAVALISLSAIVVAMFGLAFWLLAVGAPAPWLARHLRLTPDRLLVGTATLVALASVAGVVWLRGQLDHPRSAIGQLDLRAAATATRLSGENSLMESLNQRGIRSMVLLGGLLVLAAVAVGAFRSAALLAGTMAFTGVLVEFLKTSPPRPLPVLGQVSEHITSWPSGHAALQASLALGVVLWWWGAHLPRPSIVAAIMVPLAVLIGYSRTFLGIHWLSEVFAGWLVATAAAGVVLAVDRLVIPRLALPAPSRRWPVLVAGAIALLITMFSIHSVNRFHDRGPRDFAGNFPRNFSFTRSAPPAEPTELAAADPKSVLDPLPRFSETQLGGHVQPLGLVVVATDDRFRAAIRKAGWRNAEVLTPDGLASRLWSGFPGGSEHNAPVAPTFFDTRAADLVVRKSGAQGGQTHEAEIWQLPLATPGSCSVWAVTASLDTGTEWNWHTLFPDYRIASAIDKERDALAGELETAGPFDDLGRFGFVEATHGKAPGGAYVTDGKVVLLRQPECK